MPGKRPGVPSADAEGQGRCTQSREPQTPLELSSPTGVQLGCHIQSRPAAHPKQRSHVLSRDEEKPWLAPAALREARNEEASAS